MNACKLNQEEASQLLDNYHWNVSEAIRFWHNEQKKMEKINKKLEKKKGKTLLANDGLMEGKLNCGATEMQTIQTNNDENDNDNNNDEFDNSHQGSLTAGFCCN